MRTPSRVAAMALAAFMLAACSGAGATPSTAPTNPPLITPPPTPVVTVGPTAAETPSPTVAPTTAPSVAVTEAPSVAPTPSPLPVVSAACMAPSAPTKKTGRLTLSTDNPAFPPWWGGTVPDGSDWASFGGYPPSGDGYEGATAYAIAAALGYTPDLVDWIPNAVFENAFKPGPKAFDFHLAQISIRPKRAQNVDFSDPYFDANQSVIAMTKAKNGSASPILAVTTIAGLKDFKLGAATGTTSLELIESAIQPTQDPQVYNDNAAARQALLNHQIDGLVVDLQTAFFMRDAQLEDSKTPEPDATVVGQFAVSAQVDQMGIVLQKDSPLTACVDQGLALIKANGTLQTIYDTWISAGQAVPFFQ